VFNQTKTFSAANTSELGAQEPDLSSNQERVVSHDDQIQDVGSSSTSFTLKSITLGETAHYVDNYFETAELNRQNVDFYGNDTSGLYNAEGFWDSNRTGRENVGSLGDLDCTTEPLDGFWDLSWNELLL
jgi:hypothetical protein